MGRIKRPLTQIKFRFLGLLLPLLCPLVFSLAYPSRNDFYFREQIAIIDINTWLSIGENAIGWITIAIILMTVIFFIIHEVIPLLSARLSSERVLPEIVKGQYPRLDTAMATSFKNPDGAPSTLLLSPDDKPIIYRSGSDKLIISEASIDILDDDELEAIIGHEIAHHSSYVSRINRFLLILRWLHFYNPLALLIFRRVIKDIEKTCDDLAIQSSGNRLSLASGLIKVNKMSNGNSTGDENGEQTSLSRNVKFKEASSKSLVKERVQRLVSYTDGDIPYLNFNLTFTALILTALLFFIV